MFGLTIISWVQVL